MPFRDPVLVLLLGSAIATLFVLLERRRRDRLTVLDRFAARHGMRCERSPPLAAMAPLEPLSLLPPVVAVERMVTGVLRAGPLVTTASLWACLCGNRHRARPYLLGVFAGPPELPTLRLLPEGEREVREDLGFVAMPAEGLPPGYGAEAFQPLSRRLTLALGAELGRTPGFRVEMRPGRLLLSTSELGPERLDAMMDLGLRLLRAADGTLGEPEAPPVPAAPPAAAGGLLN